MNRTLKTFGCLLLAGSAFIGASATAQEFDLSGKRVDVIVPLAEGGSTDTYGRFMAQRIAAQLPGSPSLIVKNIPGGSTKIGTNAFQQTEPDGMTLFTLSGGIPLIWTFDRDTNQVQFDPRTWEALVSSPFGYVAYANIGETGWSSLKDMKATLDQELVYGMSTTKGSAMLVLLSLQMLGLNVKPIFGVDGGEAELAFERGEFDINSDSMAGYKRNVEEQVKAGEIFPIFAYGFPDETGEIGRDPNVPDIMTFKEVYTELHGEVPSGPAWEIWQKLFSMISLGSKAIVMKADTPDHIKAVYHDAVADMLSDPSFATDAEKFVGSYPQTSGERAQATLTLATSLTDEERQWLADWYKENYDVDLD